MGQTTPKSTPYSLEARTSMLGLTPLTTQTTARSVYALLHNYATTSPMVTMERPKFTPKTTTSPSTITTPSNTPIPRPIPLITPNGIQIQSAVLPQYTLRTDRQTDRPNERPTDGPGE